MMYPKIYSLSTLNIIHHHNCDYLFHSLRTDFTGESGSGKSMISDMLQLILVGPNAYESSTYAYGDRKPQGMVLKNNGIGYGYIFSNIEVGKGEFVVIGSYIEAGAGNVFNFIMQSGFDWQETLLPLKIPLFYKHLIKGNSLLPFEQLKDHLLQIGVNIKKIPIAKYHAVLFKNEILPVDLSLSEKTLKNYALILRSFSRGKVFEKKSDNLKEFLFGDEKEKQLRREFEADVQSVHDDLENHKSLKSEIELINKAETTLNELSELHTNYKLIERKYCHTKIAYWEAEKKKLAIELDSANKEYMAVYSELYYLEMEQLTGDLNNIKSQVQNRASIESELSTLVGQEAKLFDKRQATEDVYFKYKSQREIIDQFQQLLEKYGGSVDQLKSVILEDIKYKQLKLDLIQFESYLNANDVVEDFNSGKWVDDYLIAKQQANKRIAEIGANIVDYTSLSRFTDIDNNDSLAHWAINFFKRPLSIEEESVLVYFQKFPKENTKDSLERHLPFPDELFNNLDIRNASLNGFWLNLDGVFEFIPYVKKQILDAEITTKKIKQIHKLASTLADEISKAETEKRKIEKILNVLDSFSNVKGAIDVYRRKAEITGYKSPFAEDVSQEKLDLYLSTFAEKDRIESVLPSAEKEARDAAFEFTNFNARIGSLNQKLDEIRNSLAQFDKVSIDQYVDKLSLQIMNKKQELKLFKQKQNLSEEQLEAVRRSLVETYNNLQVHTTEIQNAIIEKASRKNQLDIEISGLNAKREKANVILANSLIDFKILIGEEYKSVDLPDIDLTQDPDLVLKNEYQKAKILYETKYQAASSSLDDKVLLDNSFHLGKLATAMLPTVFKTNRTEESTIKLKIAEKLNELNRRASSISERKIEILSTVFSKVYDTYSDYLETINQIRNYFRGENKRITGGNRVSLTYSKSGDFPDGWLTPFRKKLDAQLVNTGLFASLANELDIYDMMLKAFRESGGNPKVTSNELLNPKSYFDLAFDLKLENNSSNDGSTGQTYAATALLGIARLSIVEKTLHGTRRKGIRFMPVDEAEGLGGNYNMLYEIAKEEAYQLISMSIEPVGEFVDGEQYIYILNENPIASNEYNPPFGIFSSNNIVENISEFIQQKQ